MIPELGRPLEEGTATHSSILSWENSFLPGRIPWTEEPNRIQSMGSQRVGLDLVTKWASVTAQLVKSQPAMQETPVQFLGWEDPLEKV